MQSFFELRKIVIEMAEDTLCEIHHKKHKLICIDCNTIICSTMTESCKNVSDQFKQLHDMLVIEEHRITSILNDKIQQTSSTIHDIINQIKNINTIFKPSSTTCKFNDDDSINDDEIIQSITTCSSLDHFTDQTFPTTTSMPSETDSVTINITDIELLRLVQRNINQINSAPHIMTKPVTVDIDTKTLDSIKEQLRSCFQLLEVTEKYTHDIDGQVMSIDIECYTLYSPITNTWTKVQNGVVFEYSSTAVYARGNVYLFGGQGSEPTYSRYSLADRQWHHNLPMVGEGVQSGLEASLCYDGDRTIYLVGGEIQDAMGEIIKRMTRIDSFNIETLEFKHIGDFKYPSSLAFVIHHNNILYLFDGCIYLEFQDGEQFGCYFTYDLATKEENTIKMGTTMESLAYDGEGNVYIIYKDDGKFFHYSILTKIGTELMAPPPAPQHQEEEFGRNLIWYTPEKGTILYLRGKGMNCKYSTRLNQWTELQDDDPQDGITITKYMNGMSLQSSQGD
ncbi:hypothetical protein SAMD00019534_052830 [Acytostelium subglobosum LB1]|uniref:hypothetical protein n=1 Tax=Acytostelium subglobosum LB1 TaxID=1410327 RepID=UPI0006448401|nr:hypothetical protein SAMD00019534_052830 [Acytostelium subglobosum LB1]GAM22108.1 hypothetical protein SAMD00019534_052830 [Acytostelium subglobosum LB1]|eukprot:XP_012755208.1 hypothetical protein SAMD00019534_052830 [Acytostelium subglobosum LB1]